MSDLATIRQNTFLKMAESSGATFTDNEVDGFINREYEYLQTRINMKNDEFFGKEVITSTTGAPSYAFPSDFIKLLSIELKTPGSQDDWTAVPKIPVYRRREYRFKRWWMYGETPTRYYIIGNNYYFVPDQDPGSNNLRLVYLFKLDPLVDDADEPAIPDPYHELLEIGATNRLRTSIKEPPIDLQHYKDMIQSLIDTISPRVKGSPRQVRLVQGLY